jgi:hypothetical protein
VLRIISLFNGVTVQTRLNFATESTLHTCNVDIIDALQCILDSVQLAADLTCTTAASACDMEPAKYSIIANGSTCRAMQTQHKRPQLDKYSDKAPVITSEAVMSSI